MKTEKVLTDIRNRQIVNVIVKSAINCCRSVCSSLQVLERTFI